MITSNLEPVIAELRAMLARTADMQPALHAIGEMQAESIRARITTMKTSPDGEEWSPWSKRRLKERTEKGNLGQGLLWDTGTLLHSIVVVDDPTSVVIGTPVKYADELQYGRDDMGPRPFIGWVEDKLPLVEQMLARYVEFGVLS